MKRILPILLVFLTGSALPPDPWHATFSIVCRDPRTGDFGVAVTTMPTQVRRWCPFAKAGVGAVCTQAMTNRQYGPDGLELLAKGKTPAQVVEELTAADDQRNHRQVGAIDAKGKGFSYTGKQCMKWCGHLVGKDYTVQGNLLVSEETIKAAAAAFERTPGSLARRMIEALRAGKAAGGDKRGHRSAAVIVASKRSGEREYLIDLSEDDNPEPVEKVAEKFLKDCAEWFEIGDREFGEGNEGGDVLQLEELLKKEKFFAGGPDAKFDAETKAALEAWQKKKRLDASGRVDAKTLKELAKARKTY